MRDLVCFVPLVIILPNYMGIKGILWAAPISDTIGIILSFILVIKFFKKLSNQSFSSPKEKVIIQDSKEGIIIAISRQHGTQGKIIGQLVADMLNIPCYYKEVTALAAKDSGLDQEFVSKINQSGDVLHNLYLTTVPVKYAIEAQEKVIKMIANRGSCVIIGRAADYVLGNYSNVVKILIYAPKKYRIEKIMEMYHDTREKAIHNIDKSDKNRSSYYQMISGQTWGNIENYDICINAEIGKEQTAQIICEYIKKKNL